MANGHVTCRAHALKLLEDSSYKLHQLRDMVTDECPAVRKISSEDIDQILDLLWLLRRKVTTCEENPKCPDSKSVNSVTPQA